MHKGHDCSPTEEAALECKVESDRATLFPQTGSHCAAVNTGVLMIYSGGARMLFIKFALTLSWSVWPKKRKREKDLGRLSNNTFYIPQAQAMSVAYEFHCFLGKWSKMLDKYFNSVLGLDKSNAGQRGWCWKRDGRHSAGGL